MFFRSAPQVLTRECAVYAALNAAGQIIYVGQSYDPIKRWEEHECRQPWAHEIAQWQLMEWLPSKAEALARETQLIRTLRTRWNIDESPVAAEVVARYQAFGYPLPTCKPRNQRPWALRALVFVVMALLWIARMVLTGTLRLAWVVLTSLLGYFFGIKPRRRRRRRRIL